MRPGCHDESGITLEITVAEMITFRVIWAFFYVILEGNDP